MASPSLSSALVELVAAAPAPAPSPEAQNALLWTRDGDPLTASVEEDNLAYSDGGLDHERELRPRICAIVGPGATLRGIAAKIKPIVDRATGTGPAVDLDTLAKALLYYNRGYLNLPKFDAWKVGMRLTLPIEIDLGPMLTPSLKRYITKRISIASWAGLADPKLFGLLDKAPADLALPDPVALRTGAVSDVTNKQPNALAFELRIPLMTNPYEAVFRVIETVRQLRLADAAAGTTNALRFVLSLYDAGITREPCLMLGFTTGGHACLRAFRRVLDAGDRSALSATDQEGYDGFSAAVATGLKLTPDGAGGFMSLDDARPGIIPVEPPFTKKQLQGTGGKGGEADFEHPLPNEDPGGRRALVLGRNITIGVPAELADKKKRTWAGHTYGGRLDPEVFRAAHQAEVGTAGAADPVLAAALKVAITIAPNEAWLDGARMADRAMLSIGIQQWSIHVNNEATVLLRRFKEHAPEHYDLFFGMYGLDVRVCGSGANESKPESDPAVQAGNPELGAMPPYGSFFPRRATFWGTATAGAPLVLLGIPSDPALPSDVRVQFFATQDPKDKMRMNLREEWCARTRIASLGCVDFNLNQLEVAAYRFKRLELEGLKGTVAGVSHPAKELFPSEFGAALVLDQSINGPGDVTSAIRRAIARVPNTVTAHDPVTGKLADDWLMRFTVDYAGERQLADKAHRDDWILRQHDKGWTAKWSALAPDPGSFGGWP